MRLSVIVPAYNAAPYLRSALDSVLRELPGDSEVIVVNDGSTDETVKILEGYDGAVRTIHLAGPTCPSDARNAGAGIASGRYIAFHDSDDLVLPGRFDAELEVLESRPEVGLVFGNGVKIDAVGRALGPLLPVRYCRRLKRRAGTAELLVEPMVYAQAFCMRRRDFDCLGGFRLHRVEDWEFTLRASLALRLHFLDVPVFAYRKHQGTITTNQGDYAERALVMLEGFLSAHPEVEQQVGPRLVRRALARRLARCARHRARAGDLPGAVNALSRAIHLAPTSLRYRRRYLALALPSFLRRN